MLCHKQGEVSVRTGAEDRVFGTGGKFSVNDFSSPKEKDIKVIGAIQGIDKRSSNSRKTLGQLSFSIQVVLPGSLQQNYPQQFQISSLRELSYQSKIILDSKCLEELKW